MNVPTVRHLQLSAYPSASAGSAVTIGNFDGMHLGHQTVLSQLTREAGKRGLTPSVMLFEPQPLEFLRPEQAPPRLMSLSGKLHYLRGQQQVRAAVMRFSQALADLPAEAFVQQVLHQRLGAALVLVGDDFRFGNGRSGDVALLRRMGRQLGFEVVQTQTHQQDGRRVSSTWVREALMDGDLALASRLLGRAYSMRGRVLPGQQLGRQLGFPTLNIALSRVPALAGVYAVEVQLDGQILAGVANVGRRPTVDGSHWLLEVHLLDWQGNAYGRVVEVLFGAFLRGERRFAGLDALRAQIAQDVACARDYWAMRASQWGA